MMKSITAVPGQRPPQRSWDRFRAYMKKYWFIYLLAIPGLCFMITFNYGPMYGIQLAFKDYSIKGGVWGSPWIGFAHFQEMFQDPFFWRALKNTVFINVFTLLFGFTFNIFLALMINELRFKKMKSVVQTFVYLPYFLSWVIFAGLVIIFLGTADNGGLINRFVLMLGGPEVDFLKKPEYFQLILVITNIIKTAGYSTIIYLAAIAGVNPSLYESAVMDGANRFHLLWHITLPRILPSIAVMFILHFDGSAIGANRNDLLDLMTKQYGVRCIVQYYPLYRYPLFQKKGMGAYDCPVLDEWWDNSFSLPWWCGIDDESLRVMTDGLKSAVADLKAGIRA